MNQFAALEKLHLCHLHDALRWFVVWVSQGWYEFCSLPYATKIRLSQPDVEALNTLPDHYTGIKNQCTFTLTILILYCRINGTAIETLEVIGYGIEPL